jgi:hypothetical protein
MKANQNILTSFLMLSFIALCLMVVPKISYADLLRPLGDKTAQQIEKYRKEALSSDASHVAEMIEKLQKDDHPDSRTTILRALARMGAVEALPAINEIIAKDPGIARFAQAARIRLLAETESTPQAKVTRFFKELGESPAQFNAVTRTYNKDMMTNPIVVPYPMERHALEELADMLYHGSYTALMAQPQMAQVDFTLDADADQKFLLAPLPVPQRRTKLVEELSHENWRNQHETQLLLELGRKEAGEAALTKLEEMDGDRTTYKPGGFLNMLEVLYASGDHYQSPIWDKFKHDDDPQVANFACLPRVDNFVYGY